MSIDSLIKKHGSDVVIKTKINITPDVSKPWLTTVTETQNNVVMFFYNKDHEQRETLFIDIKDYIPKGKYIGVLSASYNVSPKIGDSVIKNNISYTIESILEYTSFKKTMLYIIGLKIWHILKY